MSSKRYTPARYWLKAQIADAVMERNNIDGGFRQRYGHPFCVACGHRPTNGHDDDCPIAKYLNNRVIKQ